MTDLIFLEATRVVVAGIVGGAWVSIATVAANLRGTKLGGTIGGLPSISSFSFLFIALNQSPQAAAEATHAFPLALSFTVSFLIIYAYTLSRGVGIALAVSVTAWLGLSIPAAAYGPPAFYIELALLATVSVIALALFGRMGLSPVKGGGKRPTGRESLRRGIVGGAVVGTVVLCSQVLGPVWGGVLAAFPGIFSLTLYFTYRTEGERFSRSMVKPLMIAALATALPYSIIVGYLLQTYGALLGTGVALLCVAPVALVLAHE